MAVHVDEQVALRADHAADGGGAIQAEFANSSILAAIGKPRGHAVEGRQFDGVETGGDGLFGHGGESGRRAVHGGAVDVGVIANAVVQSVRPAVRGRARRIALPRMSQRHCSMPLSATAAEVPFSLISVLHLRRAATRYRRCCAPSAVRKSGAAASPPCSSLPCEASPIPVNAGAGAQARQHPIAAMVHLHLEDVQIGNGDPGGFGGSAAEAAVSGASAQRLQELASVHRFHSIRLRLLRAGNAGAWPV